MVALERLVDEALARAMASRLAAKATLPQEEEDSADDRRIYFRVVGPEPADIYSRPDRMSKALGDLVTKAGSSPHPSLRSHLTPLSLPSPRWRRRAGRPAGAGALA
ncbi:unnamed protein product [Prorocentrum cordatum]|uniref:Uncharacterized protein n=1 Tax=Prorocentrum cordatum TaxID=2364126 RepID=A0ABN9RFU3_9DINO|nr:unnamed protein product [Polarella glacialis]